MKIVLFDWTTTGHHQRYIARFSEVLSNKHDVIAAIPDEMIEAVENLPIKILVYFIDAIDLAMKEFYV